MRRRNCATCHTEPRRCRPHQQQHRCDPGCTGHHRQACQRRLHRYLFHALSLGDNFAGHNPDLGCRDHRLYGLPRSRRRPPATTPSTSPHVALGGNNCGTCHTGATAGVTGGPGHGNTLIDVAGTLTSGYPTPKAKGSPYATCTTSCHSAYPGSILTPTWGTAATCASCHEASPTTGDHTKHIASVVLGGNNCGSCHTGATAGTSGGSNHLDGNIDIGGTLAGVTLNNIAKHNAPFTTTCTTSCHSAYPGTVATPTWGIGSHLQQLSPCHRRPPATTPSTSLL